MEKNMFPSKIVKFLTKHHVATIATGNEKKLWCFNAFYVFDKENISLVISSNEETTHVQQVVKNPSIAGSIVLETEAVSKIEGLQFSGSMVLCKGLEEKKAKKIYLKRFPFAILTPKTLWKIEIHYAKFTDNTLGFGKKIIWNKKGN